jgi:hypothetical protein
MALDEAASALRSLARGWNVASSCFMYSTIGGVGVGGGLLVGVADDEDFFRKRRMHVDCPKQNYTGPHLQQAISRWSVYFDCDFSELSKEIGVNTGITR